MIGANRITSSSRTNGEPVALQESVIENSKSSLPARLTASRSSPSEERSASLLSKWSEDVLAELLPSSVASNITMSESSMVLLIQGSVVRSLKVKRIY